MTPRTHEIAHALQMAGLAQPTNLVELAAWIERYVEKYEALLRGDFNKGMRFAYEEVFARADTREDANEAYAWKEFAKLQLANLDRLEGSGT